MKRVLFAALCASLLAPAKAQLRLAQNDVAVVEVTLDTIRRQPDAFQNVRVRFEVQFCSLGKIWNPFFTRFVPSEYANFYAWSGTQPIWRKDSYEDVFGMLFLSKSSMQLNQLYNYRTYDRLQIEGVVQNVFQGNPWIEVLDMQLVPGRVDNPTLTHLYRADSYMQKREWSKAISELSLAPGKDQPDHVMAAINKNLGICYLRTGEAARAEVYLNTADRLSQGDDMELSRLARAAAEDPSSQLDRAIDKSHVDETKRPLWEAFDDVADDNTKPKTQGTDTGAPARPGR